MERRSLLVRILLPTCGVCLCLLGPVDWLFRPFGEPVPSCWERLSPMALGATGIALLASHLMWRRARKSLDTVLAPLLAFAALGWSLLFLLRIWLLVASSRDPQAKPWLFHMFVVLFHLLACVACAVGAIYAAPAAGRAKAFVLFLSLLGLAAALFVYRPNFYVVGSEVRSEDMGFHVGQTIWVSERTSGLNPGDLVVLGGHHWLRFNRVAQVIHVGSARVHCAAEGVLSINDTSVVGANQSKIHCKDFVETMGRGELLVRGGPNSCQCGRIVDGDEIVARILSRPGP